MAVPLRLAIACLLVVSALPAGVSAQASTIPCTPSSDSTEARALFRAGVAASDQERWSDAVDSLRRSFELSCEAPPLFNLGAALRALGRHREARDAFQQLLTLDLPEGMRPMAEQFLREAAARVAILELLEVAPDARPDISFDGRPVPDDGRRPIRLETDAGGHSLVLRLEDYQPFLWNGELTDGQVERVVVELEPIPVREVSSSDGGGGLDSGAVAAIVIGAILAVGAAVAIPVGIVLQDEAQLQPLSPGSVITVGD